MDSFEQNYFRVNRKMLVFVGLWHSQSYRERLCRYIIISSLLFYFTCAELCKLATLDYDMMPLVFVLQLFIPTICFENVYYTSISNFAILQKLCSEIEQDWKQLKDNVELKIMQKFAYESKLFTFISGSIFCLYAILMFVSPLLHTILTKNGEIRSTDRFPVISCHDYFLDSETYYYPIFVCQIMIITIGLTVALSCYSIYFFLVQHICAHLSIIKYKIHQPFITNHDDDNRLATPSDLSDWIIYIAERFAKSREMAALMNRMSEKSYLFQTALGCMLLIVDLISIPALLKQPDSRKDIFVLVAFIIGTLFPIYINCYIGQRLQDYSMEAYTEACLVPINNISLKTQKLLLMMLILNAKPLIISIGKVFVSSHEFFQSLLRLSLSFTMMLHSTQSM